MAIGFFKKWKSKQPQSICCSCNNGNKDSANFECNICFDLAEEPIITQCGHLFCWPCLYKWLHTYSRSRECPVCTALIEEAKLVPLYGRGINSTVPRSKSIPHRPIGQRQQTTTRSAAFTGLFNAGFPYNNRMLLLVLGMCHILALLCKVMMP